MLKSIIPYLLVLAVGTVLLTACIKEPELDPKPEISFNSIKYFPNAKSTGADCIEVVVNFQDGDGNLGLDEGDTTAPFQRYLNPATKTVNPDFFNYFIEFQVQNTSGFWTTYSFPPGVPTFNGRFPRINPPTKRHTIQGTLAYYIKIFSTFPLRNRPLRFKIQIQDRGDEFGIPQKSNIIETKEIIVPD